MINTLSCTARGVAPSTLSRQVEPTAEHEQPRGRSVLSEKITAEHLQRSAIVYVRQSTQQQVLEHRESTARQYALADRAVALGWPAAAVEVIDEDQGHSGSSAEGRSGFQRLLAEVSSDRVGLILGLEMSRFAPPARIGMPCWNSVRSIGRCWRMRTDCTIPASTTTGCCWA